MSRADTARQNYSTAREELLGRINLRDTLLAAYLAAVGVIFGIAFGSDHPKQEILLVVPYLALGVAILVSQHHRVIGSIGVFIQEELMPFLKDQGEDAPHWDGSKTRELTAGTAIRHRMIGQGILILVPPLAALIWNWKAKCGDGPGPASIWWFGSGAVIAAVIFLWKTHNWREEVHRRLAASK